MLPYSDSLSPSDVTIFICYFFPIKWFWKHSEKYIEWTNGFHLWHCYIKTIAVEYSVSFLSRLIWVAWSAYTADCSSNTHFFPTPTPKLKLSFWSSGFEDHILWGKCNTKIIDYESLKFNVEWGKPLLPGS